MSINISQHLTWPQLFKYVAPSIAMMIFTSIYGIVDGFFVSNFAGKTALAAVNFIMPVATILATVGFMIGTGGSALVSKTRGEGDERRAKRYFSLLVYTAATIGILLAISGFVFIPTLAQAMSAQGQMLSDSIVYGRMMMITLPFFVLQYVFQSFFVAAGKPQVGFFVILGAGVANILLDALLVGAFGWGLEGAALATNISQLIGGGAGLIYFARKNSSFLQLGSCSFEIRVLGRACLNGSSEMMSNVAASLVAILYNVQLMHYLGEEGVAAYGVIMYVVMIFAAVFMGYSMGSAPLMSYQLGAGNTREMRSLLKKGLAFIGVSGIAMFALAQILAKPIALVFVGYDPGLTQLTVEAFRVYSFAFLLMGFSIFGSSFFTSLNNGTISAAISFLRTLVFEAGAIIVLPLIMGASGIWASINLAELASVIVTSIFMIKLGKHYGYLGSQGAAKHAVSEAAKIIAEIPELPAQNTLKKDTA